MATTSYWIKLAAAAVLAGGMIGCAPQGDTAADQPAAKKPVALDASAKRAERPSNHPRLSEKTVLTADVPYVADAAALQKLDVYAPRDVKDAPVIIYIHGGEWAKHDKKEVSYKPQFFNDNGVIFVSANYRLSGEDKHPAQIEDVASAVKWVHDHIAEYGGNPGNVYLMGHSAGCHLVTLAGLDGKWLNQARLKPTDLAGVISWSGGAFDLVAKEAEKGMYAQYIDQCFGSDPAVWADASPINHIKKGQAMPRFLFASAGGDKEGSRALSQTMVQRIKEAGGSAQWVILPGKVHWSADYAVGLAGDTTGNILLDFVNKK